MIKARFLSELDDVALEKLRASVVWKQMCFGYLFLEGSASYYSEYHGSSFEVLSFAIIRNDEPVLLFPCTVKDGLLSWFHFPAEVFVIDEPASVQSAFFKVMFAFIERMRHEARFSRMHIAYSEFIVSEYFHRITDSHNHHFAIVDYSYSDEQIRTNVRKSYKSLLNWGQRNMSLVVTDKSNPDRERYREFREFHVRVAGRKTRSDRSWDLHFNMLEQGNAYLVSGYYEQRLVSNVFVLHGMTEGFYGVGVNDRSLMEKKAPISHYPLLAAIFHGRKVGLKYFNMNEVDTKGENGKADNIARFKQGFTNIIRRETSYQVRFEASLQNN